MNSNISEINKLLDVLDMLNDNNMIITNRIRNYIKHDYMIDIVEYLNKRIGFDYRLIIDLILVDEAFNIGGLRTINLVIKRLHKCMDSKEFNDCITDLTNKLNKIKFTVNGAKVVEFNTEYEKILTDFYIDIFQKHKLHSIEYDNKMNPISINGSIYRADTSQQRIRVYEYKIGEKGEVLLIDKEYMQLLSLSTTIIVDKNMKFTKEVTSLNQLFNTFSESKRYKILKDVDIELERK